VCAQFAWTATSMGWMARLMAQLGAAEQPTWTAAGNTATRSAAWWPAWEQHLGDHRAPPPIALILLLGCCSLLGVEAPGMAEMVHNCIQARVLTADEPLAGSAHARSWQLLIHVTAHLSCTARLRLLWHFAMQGADHTIQGCLADIAEWRNPQPPAAVQQHCFEVSAHS